MPDYLRNFVPGGTFLFTVAVHQRRNILTETTGIDCLREAFRDVKNQHPFAIDAIIILPDHLHAIWTLPDGDDNYPMICVFIRYWNAHKPVKGPPILSIRTILHPTELQWNCAGQRL